MQDFEDREEKKERIIDIKGTLEGFIEEEKPELSQEEAIKAYRKGDIIEYHPKKRKGNNNGENDEENEDDEHLKRVKKALLESLKRVDIMEKKIFEEKGKENLKNIKVKSGSQKSKGKSQDIENNKVIEQMRQKMQDENEKGRSRE